MDAKFCSDDDTIYAVKISNALHQQQYMKQERQLESLYIILLAFNYFSNHIFLFYP